MKLENMRSFAKSNSIELDHLSKSALISTTPIDEGNFDCVANASSGECDQSGALPRGLF